MLSPNLFFCIREIERFDLRMNLSSWDEEVLVGMIGLTGWDGNVGDKENLREGT
jgi:hypothetical protein